MTGGAGVPGERIADYLVADHRRLEQLLQQARGGAELDEAAFSEFRRGILRHIAIEEKILFPEARAARGGMPLAQASVLKIAHAAIATLLVTRPTFHTCTQLAGLLEHHDADEEGPDGVYEECERAIGPERSARLAKQARAFGEVRVSAYR